MQDKELASLLVTQTRNLNQEIHEGNKIEIKTLAKNLLDILLQNQNNPITKGLLIHARAANDAAQNLKLTTTATDAMYQLALIELLKAEKVAEPKQRQVSALGEMMYPVSPEPLRTFSPYGWRGSKQFPFGKPIPELNRIEGLSELNNSVKAVSVIILGLLLGTGFYFFRKRS